LICDLSKNLTIGQIVVERNLHELPFAGDKRQLHLFALPQRAEQMPEPCGIDRSARCSAEVVRRIDGTGRSGGRRL